MTFVKPRNKELERYVKRLFDFSNLTMS